MLGFVAAVEGGLGKRGAERQGLVEAVLEHLVEVHGVAPLCSQPGCLHLK